MAEISRLIATQGKRIIFIEDFESIYHHTNANLASGALLKRQADLSLFGNSALALSHPLGVTGSSTLSWNVPGNPVRLKRISITILFLVDTLNTTLTLRYQENERTRITTYGIKIQPSQNLWYFLNRAGTWEALPQITTQLTYKKWYTIEMTIDTREQKIISLRINLEQFKINKYVYTGIVTNFSTWASYDVAFENTIENKAIVLDHIIIEEA